MDLILESDLVGDADDAEIFWLVDDGARVEEGQDLAEIETAKAKAVLTAPAAGRLTIVAGTGAVVAADQRVGTIH